MFYSQLGSELKYPARGMGRVLGTVGSELQKLSRSWSRPIPPIQCLVVNRQTRLPGRGIGWFVPNRAAFEKCGPSEKRRIMDALLSEVFTFQNWQAVLKAFGMNAGRMRMIRPLPAQAIAASAGHGEGESPEHKALKEYVSMHPEIVGLPKKSSVGQTEHPFESNDAIDVLFQHGDEWVGAEVKSARSPETDILRGLFQCVKYQALIEAQQRYRSLRLRSRVVLVIEDKLPESLAAAKHVLGVSVIDGVVAGKPAKAATA